MKTNSHSHVRLLSVVIGLVAILIAVGALSASAVTSPLPPQAAPALAPAYVNPINSPLAPSQAQTGSCVDRILQYTDLHTPDVKHSPTVVTATQMNDAQLAAFSPRMASHGVAFGRLMTVVVLRGTFQVGRQGTVPAILYVLDPFPSCYPTIVTYDVSDVALPK